MRNELNFLSSTFFAAFGLATQIVAARVGTSGRQRALMALPSILVQSASWVNYWLYGYKLLDQIVAHLTGTTCFLWALRSKSLNRRPKVFMALAYTYSATGYYLLGGYLCPQYSNEIQATIHIVVSLAWFNTCVHYCLNNASSYIHLPGLQLNCACAECNKPVQNC